MRNNGIHQFIDGEGINDTCKKYHQTNIQTEANLKFWINKIYFSTIRHRDPLNNKASSYFRLNIRRIL